MEERERRPQGSSIVDDTTQQVYGPTTALKTKEKFIKENTERWDVPDTSVTNFHRYEFTAQNENTFQHLGNIATATAPIYPQMPEVIGARLGFDTFDEYFQDPEDIDIYNTLSPYSKFGIIWGGQGRSVTRAAYTRNIDARSNFGFNYRGLFIDKQVERERRGDRNVSGTYYNFHGNYATKNGRYRALGNFSRHYHTLYDYGGILPEDFRFIGFFEENRQGNLIDVENNELRTHYHLYHQYRFSERWQLYHTYDRSKQWNEFGNSEETNDDFFGPVVPDSVSVGNRSKMIYKQHEVGLKGDMGDMYYRIYYRGREVNMDYRYIDEGGLDFGTYFVENYGGFHLRFDDDSLSHISVAGEYLSGGNYKLEAEWNNRRFYLKGIGSRYWPTYVQRAYLGRHNSWQNEYAPISDAKLETGLDVNYGPLSLRPGASYRLLSNYVYFRRAGADAPPVRDVTPEQESENITMITFDGTLVLRFLRNFTLTGRLIYTEVSGGGARAINVPEVLTNVQLAYGNTFYDGNLKLQAGVDFHQKSDYFANAYDPSTRQFYVQDVFSVYAFPVLDVFLNVKINRGRAFLKINNLYQLFRETGYFLTPYYPAQDTILDFGIDWALFD